MRISDWIQTCALPIWRRRTLLARWGTGFSGGRTSFGARVAYAPYSLNLKRMCATRVPITAGLLMRLLGSHKTLAIGGACCESAVYYCGGQPSSPSDQEEGRGEARIVDSDDSGDQQLDGGCVCFSRNHHRVRLGGGTQGV